MVACRFDGCMIAEARFNVHSVGETFGARWKDVKEKHPWYCKPHAEIVAERLNAKEAIEKNFIKVTDYFNIIGATE